MKRHDSPISNAFSKLVNSISYAVNIVTSVVSDSLDLALYRTTDPVSGSLAFLGLLLALGWLL